MEQILLDIDNLPFKLSKEEYFIILPNTFFIMDGKLQLEDHFLVIHRETQIYKTAPPYNQSTIKRYKNLIEYPNDKKLIKKYIHDPIRYR